MNSFKYKKKRSKLNIKFYSKCNPKIQNRCYYLNKGLKIFLVIIIILVLVGAGLFIYFMFFQPEEKPPKPNTYVENSDIDFLGYSLLFTKGNIILENSFNISEGKLNGYNVINSTVNINCSINNETRLNSINLYNKVKMTMRNINKTDLFIFLHDRSTLTLENCTFNDIWVHDSSSIIIENCTIDSIHVEPLIGEPGVYTYDTSVSISNSTINYIHISEGCDFLIKNSTFTGYDSIYITALSPTAKVSGTIENSTLWWVEEEGYVNLKFKGSTLYGLFLYDMARATLIQSEITTYFYYGIVAYSGTTNIVNGIVTGSGYQNNTKVINSDVPTPLLRSVAANGSAVVNMNNYSCYLYLHDTSSAKVFNIPDNLYLPYLVGNVMDSSSLTIEDADVSGGRIYCIDNGVLKLRNTTIYGIYCDTSNSITIDDSLITGVRTYSVYSFLTNLAVDNVNIKNSIIGSVYAGGRDIVYLENCSIYYLFEGVIVDSGSLTLDFGGFSGTGSYMNSTKLVNTSIYFQRELIYVEINGNAHLTVQNNFENLYFYCQDNAGLTCRNSTIYDITAQDTTTVMANNCSIYDNVILMDGSTFNITDSYTDWIQTQGDSTAFIGNTTLYAILIFESSMVTVLNSTLVFIQVTGSNAQDYAIKVYDSTLEYLATYTWG